MKIVLYGTPVLRKVSKKVEKIDNELNETLDEMIVTMRNAKGIGLAANQVGIDKRFFVLEIEDEIKKIINPEIEPANPEEHIRQIKHTRTANKRRPITVNPEIIFKNAEE